MTGVLEQGDLHVLYRPAVGEHEPSGIVDVADLHLVMVPEGSRTRRLLTVGKKRLPRADDEHERFWGYVAGVTDDADELARELGEQRYDTETRGRQVRPACRPAAAGRYDLRRRARDTVLTFVLDQPEDRGTVQEELRIPDEASFVLAVKNPEAGSPPGVGLGDERGPELPDPLEDRFEGRRWAPADPPALLDHPGVELLFIGATGDVGELWTESADAGDPSEQLRLRAEEHPVEPLVEGGWT